MDFRYLFIAALLFIAAVCFLNLNVFKWLKKVINSEDGIRGRLERFLEQRKEGRKNNLRQRVDVILGRQRVNFWSKNFEQARRILVTTNQESKLRMLNLICVVFFIIGAVLALLAQNILLFPVLSIGATLVPMWYVKFNEFHYINRLASELEVALSVITTSYLRTENLLQSVEENLHYIDKPARDAFAKFLNQVKYVDANVANAIEGLKGSFTNSIFQEWCDTMLLCQSDRTLKYSLQPIVDQFSDNKDLQQSMETTLLQPTREYRNVVLIVVACFPMLYFLNRDWFNIVVGTFGGKFLVTGLSVVLFFGMNKAVNLSRPIN